MKQESADLAELVIDAIIDHFEAESGKSAGNGLTVPCANRPVRFRFTMLDDSVEEDA